MVRNAILLISTLAVLLLAFVLYQSAVVGPARPSSVGSLEPVADLPATTQVADAEKLLVQGVPLEPGREMVYVNYDPVTGLPTDYLSLDTWEKVPGTQNELLVVNPELMMRLRSGMIVTITAERGQIKAESVSKKRVHPKFGWLEGRARIVIDRETGFERTPLRERPEDGITIEMERLEFDLDLGELKTAEPLRVKGADFEITGRGLHLIWNQTDNRVEKLLIENGGRMVFEGALLASLDEASTRREPAGDPPVTLPAAGAASPPPKRNRNTTGYRCALTGGVTVERLIGDEQDGALRADELVLVFDIAGSGRGLSRRAATPEATTAPASQPNARPPERLVVSWSGRLDLNPAGRVAGLEKPRRQVEARGQPVVAKLPAGEVRCGRLVLHKEANRVWLYPAENGLVELSSAGEVSVRAASMFADLDANVMKLIGDVRFESRAGTSSGARPVKIRCDLWAELHFAAETVHDDRLSEDVFDNPLVSRAPKSALFVGDVAVEYQDRLLSAHRLAADFRQAAKPTRSEALAEPPGETPQAPPPKKVSALGVTLDAVVATGGVRLAVSDDARRSGWRAVLKRRAGVLERALVRVLAAQVPGKVGFRGRRETPALECAALRLELESADSEIRVRRMRAAGGVEVHDRRGRFAARGRELTAAFVGREEVEQATVRGSRTVPATVRARGYTLRGGAIDVDSRDRTLHVDGRSRLAFRSRRSLQGFTRPASGLVTVSSSESMHIDDEQNTIHFVGQVVAGSGNEQLLADTLTLLLEDVETVEPPTGWARAAGVFRLFRRTLSGASQPADASGALFALQGSRGEDHKELVRVLAHNAAAERAEGETEDGSILLHQSITAPELDIDVRGRLIRTIGRTVLGMQNLQRGSGADAGRSSIGLPSALMSRGPSQTAMRCANGMVYLLGEDGPSRRDSVLFHGGVEFRHVAGRRMYGFEQLFPDLVRNPEQLRSIKDQNTSILCDQLEAIFIIDDAALASAVPGAASTQLAWINALGNVILTDQQEDSVRSIYAHQLEYDRSNRLIRVLGMPEKGLVAKVYDEKVTTGRTNRVESSEIIVDLETGTVSAKQIRGRIGG